MYIYIYIHVYMYICKTGNMLALCPPGCPSRQTDVLRGDKHKSISFIDSIYRVCMYRILYIYIYINVCKYNVY